MTTYDDHTAMRRALALATRGRLPDPNPRVGAVVLDPDGLELGTGFHAGAGTAHAEVVALAEAGSAAHGATVVVTLEPCNHTGRTGPCAQALIDAGVARVVYGQADPGALSGGGADTLRAAGIDVVGGVLADEATALNREWTQAISTGRPFVTWKFAATLDGRSAAADGTSRWITSDEARADVHERRSRCGAILVGTGTVLADDPELTARRRDGTLACRQPQRVVMGMRPIPDGARVLAGDDPAIVLRTQDPALALDVLGQRGIRHVWLEGGPRLAGAFLAAGLVDEVIAYVAPVLLGAGTAALQDAGVATMADALRLVDVETTMIGPDVRLIGRPTNRHTGQEK